MELTYHLQKPMDHFVLAPRPPFLRLSRSFLRSPQLHSDMTMENGFELKEQQVQAPGDQQHLLNERANTGAVGTTETAAIEPGVRGALKGLE